MSAPYAEPAAAAPPAAEDAAGGAPEPPRRRRRARRAAAGTALACAAGAAAWLALSSADGGRAGAGGAAPGQGTETALVERRDLADREDADGTLGYGTRRTVTSALRGTLTRLPAEGSVVRRGEALLEVDGSPTGWLMHGRRPAWRAFTPGMADGEDVRQLEANLEALGHDPYGQMTVDDEFTDATAAAIRRFQDARDLDEDGSLELGEVVFLPGDARVAERKASVGSRGAPGQPVLETTGTERVVTVQLEASKQSLVERGDGVEVELPDGQVARGRITRVSRVARSAGGGDDGGDSGGDSEATVEVTVALRGRVRGRALDQAPVTVRIARERRKDALSVPVAALVALEGGRFGVELVGRDGVRRTVPVQPGLFADGYVEVRGRGIREGARVVIPDAL